MYRAHLSLPLLLVGFLSVCIPPPERKPVAAEGIDHLELVIYSFL